GVAFITLRGTNANSQRTSTTFEVTVNPVFSAFPFGTSFPTETLPLGYKVSGDMRWVIHSGPTEPVGLGTGPTGDNTTGTGFYIITEAYVGEGAMADFTLPITNISTLTAPNLTFYYHMFAPTIGTLEVYVRNVATGVTTRVFQLNGQQQTAADQPYRKAFIPLSSFVSAGRIQVFFRGIKGAFYDGNIAIDDIFIQEGSAKDVGVKSILLKKVIAQNTDETVAIDISNFGTSPQSNFNVSYRVASGTPVVEPYTGTVGVGETKTFTFATKINRPTRGEFKVTATTELVNDSQLVNNSDTVRSVVVPTATLTFPYTESFEASDGGWTSGGSRSSWVRGTPAGSMINRASDGTKAWVTNLTGNYNNNEKSFVVSPLFSISNLSEACLGMDIMHIIDRGFDGASLQTSTDNGGTWANVGVLGDPNWYKFNLVSAKRSSVLNFSGGNGDAWSGISAGTGYIRASNAITGLSGKTSLLLRVVFASNAGFNFEGMAFDNVRISTPSITLSNANTEAPTLTSSATTGNQWFLNGSAISGATGVTFNPTIAGSYTVTSSIEGCPSVHSNAQVLVVTGDISSAKIDFALFPNPVVDGELNIVLKEFEKGKVSLQ
ncbi:MAG: hypothetical protein ORN54_09325, partial [Cyclobacteriaceae bacterium]|nr:hypothetical protein [Cyclobacteriaceae bacterium]